MRLPNSRRTNVTEAVFLTMGRGFSTGIGLVGIVITIIRLAISSPSLLGDYSIFWYGFNVAAATWAWNRTLQQHVWMKKFNNRIEIKC